MTNQQSYNSGYAILTEIQRLESKKVDLLRRKAFLEAEIARRSGNSQDASSLALEAASIPIKIAGMDRRIKELNDVELPASRKMEALEMLRQQLIEVGRLQQDFLTHIEEANEAERRAADLERQQKLRLIAAREAFERANKIGSDSQLHGATNEDVARLWNQSGVRRNL